MRSLTHWPITVWPRPEGRTSFAHRHLVRIATLERYPTLSRHAAHSLPSAVISIRRISQSVRGQGGRLQDGSVGRVDQNKRGTRHDTNKLGMERSGVRNDESRLSSASPGSCSTSADSETAV